MHFSKRLVEAASTCQSCRLLKGMAHLRIAAAAKQACQGFRQPSRPHALLQALALLAPLLLLAGLVHRQRCAADGAGVVLQHASGHNFQKCCSERVSVKKEDNARAGTQSCNMLQQVGEGAVVRSGHRTSATKGNIAANHKTSGRTVTDGLGAALVNTNKLLRLGRNMQGRNQHAAPRRGCGQALCPTSLGLCRRDLVT